MEQMTTTSCLTGCLASSVTQQVGTEYPPGHPSGSRRLGHSSSMTSGPAEPSEGEGCPETKSTSGLAWRHNSLFPESHRAIIPDCHGCKRGRAVSHRYLSECEEKRFLKARKERFGRPVWCSIQPVGRALYCEHSSPN